MTLMNNVFREYLDKFVVIYLDDILVYSKTKDEHVQHLRNVLSKLREHKLYAKIMKCEIMKNVVEYLGHFISDQGISVDKRKIEAVRNWPTPSNVSELRSFLGLASYYRKFVKGFSALVTPLTALLHKEQAFRWDTEQKKAFDEIKHCLTTAPVLLIPDPSKAFTVTTDASDFAVGAVLSQDQGQGDQPVAFESRKLSPAELNYPVHEKELLAIVHALRLWKTYLEGQRFTVITDHASLEYIKTQHNLSRRQARWLETLQSFDFEVRYRPGKTNVVADALSRQSHLAAISTLTTQLTKDASLKEMYHEDEYFRNVLEALQHSSDVSEKQLSRARNFVLEDGHIYLRRDHRLAIPNNKKI